MERILECSIYPSIVKPPKPGHVLSRNVILTKSALTKLSLTTTMAIAESSSAGARKSLKPNTTGDGTIYELPWSDSYRPAFCHPILEANTNEQHRVEKYRPVYLDDIVGNTETIARLKIIAKDGNMPHVIISGMPGIGKTTSILCLARQMLGDAYKEAVLELNASDERGGSNPHRPR